MATTNVNSGIDGLVRQSSTISYANAVGGSGNFNSSTVNQVANVKSGITFFCGRTYYRFDTTGIATDQVASAATITLDMNSQRGSTADDTEVHKFFNSTDHSSTFGSALFDTVGDAVSDEVDVGNTLGATLVFTLDSTGLAYINTQIAAGNQCAFLQRCQNDFEASPSDPAGINFRAFSDFEDGVTSERPILSITHDTGVSGFGHDVISVASGNISKVNGVATANIGKVISVD